jgi:hypothetical protein
MRVSSFSELTEEAVNVASRLAGAAEGILDEAEVEEIFDFEVADVGVLAVGVAEDLARVVVAA